MLLFFQWKSVLTLRHMRVCGDSLIFTKFKTQGLALHAFFAGWIVAYHGQVFWCCWFGSEMKLDPDNKVQELLSASLHNLEASPKAYVLLPSQTYIHEYSVTPPASMLGKLMWMFIFIAANLLAVD